MRAQAPLRSMMQRHFISTSKTLPMMELTQQEWQDRQLTSWEIIRKSLSERRVKWYRIGIRYLKRRQTSVSLRKKYRPPLLHISRTLQLLSIIPRGILSLGRICLTTSLSSWQPTTRIRLQTRELNLRWCQLGGTTRIPWITWAQ